MHTSPGCMRMHALPTVQYFNDDGFSVLNGVSPGVYFVTLLAISSWYIISTVFNNMRMETMQNGKSTATWRRLVKRILQFIVVVLWCVNLSKYSNISGMDSEEWVNVKDGVTMYEMTVHFYQSTNLASSLVCVFAFILCVWVNMGDQNRWSKMAWGNDTQTVAPEPMDQKSQMYTINPAHAQHMLPMNNMFQTAKMESMLYTGVKGGEDEPFLATSEGAGSVRINISANSTNDTISFYAFLLFFVFIQLIASRSAVCLETHLQCFIGVTLIFIVVELAYVKMYEFLWELEESVSQGFVRPHTLEVENVANNNKRELMDVHYVAWVIRLFVCAFEIILLCVLREVFMADGHEMSTYFNVFFVLGLIYVSINMLAALMQALGIAFSVFDCQSSYLGFFLPMHWYKQEKNGNQQRQQLRSFAIWFAPLFYILLIVFTTVFCCDKLVDSSELTKNGKRLYASLTQQYLKANNYVEKRIVYEAQCANGVPKAYQAQQHCFSDRECGEQWLVGSPQMMLVHPGSDSSTVSTRLDESHFKHNSWVDYVDPFHMKIGFWTKFFEIKKVEFVKDGKLKWTAAGVETDSVLCENFFAMHADVNCGTAAAYQKSQLT